MSSTNIEDFTNEACETTYSAHSCGARFHTRLFGLVGVSIQ